VNSLVTLREDFVRLKSESDAEITRLIEERDAEIARLTALIPGNGGDKKREPTAKLTIADMTRTTVSRPSSSRVVASNSCEPLPRRRTMCPPSR
jgi:hypothetical protein